MLTRHATIKTPSGYTAVTALRKGDLVVCYGNFHAAVQNIVEFQYDDDLVVNDLYSLDHEVVADFAYFKGLHFVYLERQGKRFRLGTGSSDFPNQCWFLDWYTEWNDAECKLQTLSGLCSIPTFSFDQDIYWYRLINNRHDGTRLLKEYYLLEQYPMNISFSKPIVVPACNLMTGVFLNGHRVAKSCQKYTGLMYDITVAGHMLVQ